MASHWIVNCRFFPRHQSPDSVEFPANVQQQWHIIPLFKILTLRYILYICLRFALKRQFFLISKNSWFKWQWFLSFLLELESAKLPKTAISINFPIFELMIPKNNRLDLFRQGPNQKCFICRLLFDSETITSRPSAKILMVPKIKKCTISLANQIRRFQNLDDATHISPKYSLSSFQ